MDTSSVEKRYNNLAADSCCLSCGNAVIHAAAAEHEICLDLGSGRGNDVLRLAGEVGPGGFVYGVDVADEMLDKARSTAGKLGIKNVEFMKSTLDHVPVPGGLINLVISNCTINHAPDKQAVWNEIYRLLVKGGRFVISDIYALQDVPENYRNDPQAVAECWAGAVTRNVYFDMITRAGFENVRIIEESQPYAKGKIEVASFTVAGNKPAGCCCCRK